MRALQNLPPRLRRAVERAAGLDDAISEPLWHPYPDSPQQRALESPADVIGFGGAAGGGKSDFLLGLALTGHRKAAIFRRTHPLLKDLIGRSREIVGTRGNYNGQEKVWRLDDGRTLEFGSVQYEQDVNNFRGRPHDLKAFDEATEFSEGQFRFLIGWLRTTHPGQRCRVALTFNPPTTAEGKWVVRYFAPWIDRRHPDPAKPGELRWFAMLDGKEVGRPDGTPFDHEGETVTPTSRTFFSARLADNPRLMATGYGRTLQALPEPLRSQLLHGDFDADATPDPWQLIPTAWVEAAMDRWPGRTPDVKMTMLGMDVAHGGSDKTVLAPRHGNYFGELRKYPGSATPNGTTAAAFAAEMVEPGCPINVDAIGYGASAAERLMEPPPEGHGLPAVAVNVAAGSHFRDRSGKFKMKNLRAEMYWRLREALDPESGDDMALPPDPELLADLTQPTYRITPSGIQVESKPEIQARLGRSPDCGDAAALAMLGIETFNFL